MTAVLFLRRLVRQLVAMILRFFRTRVGALIVRIWRSLWRQLHYRLWSPLSRHVRSAIGWREDDGGGRAEPQVQVQVEVQVEGGEEEEEEEGEVEKRGSGTSSQERVEPPPDDEDDDEDEDDGGGEFDSTDVWYCGYDSTWETEERQEVTRVKRSSRPPAPSTHNKFSRFENAARDMYNYRHNYPNRPQYRIQNVETDKPNLEFYLGLRPSIPDRLYIHEIHKTWHQDYDRLERVHTYIQWLFPLPEPGMNHYASVLTAEEIEIFCANSTAKENLLKSYKLMLDFYGIELCNENTGQVRRATNWRHRFYNLNNHGHNNLRITRIIKCLGILGYPHFQAPLVLFFLRETLVHGELPNVKESALNYFVFAVLDRKQRRNLIKFAYLHYEPKDEFVWCPKIIQMMWLELSESELERGTSRSYDSYMCVSDVSASQEWTHQSQSK